MKRRNAPSKLDKAVVETLETRRLMSSIAWVNRGTGPANDTDGFNLRYGTNANMARFAVDRAIVDWEEVIVNFNHNGGGNTFNLTLNANPFTGGTRGDGGADAVDADKVPTAGTVRLDDNGGGSGWYFDSVLGDDAEFTTILNAYCADGSASGNDFYRTAVHEIGHAIGFDARAGRRLRDVFMVNSNVDDPSTGTAGNLWSVNIGGGAIEWTFTEADSGHLWEGPGTTATNNAGLPSHGDDLMNSGRTVNLGTNRRQLISDFDAALLRDVYGYTVTMPSTLNNMLVNPNFTTNALQVSGLGGSDVIVVQGSAIPGTLHCSVGPFSEIVPLSEVSTINVNGGDNVDYLRLEYNAGRPTTLSGDGGNDFIDFAFGTRNLSNITGNTYIAGGEGFDQVFTYDNNNATAYGYQITGARFDRTNWGGFSYAADIEGLTLTTGTNADIVNIPSTYPGQPVLVNSAGGADVVNIGTASAGVQFIRADMQIHNDPAFTDIYINDTGDAVARNIVMDQWSGNFGAIAGIAPAYITWDNADVQAIHITTGSSDDNFDMLRCSERLYLINSGGTDDIELGNNASGMSQVTGAIDVGPNPAFVFTDLTVNDSGGTVGRNYSWTPVGNGHNLNGLPNTLHYENVLIMNVYGGTGNDGFTATALNDNYVNVHGGGGTDGFLLDDRTMPFAFVENLMTANAFSRNTGGIFATALDVGYTGMEAVTFYSHPSATSTYIYGTSSSVPAGQQYTLFLGNNADAITVAAQDVNGNLTINGNLGIVGGGGIDSINVTSAGTPSAMNYSFANTFGPGTQNVYGVGLGGLGTAGVENITVTGGDTNDTFNVNQFSSGAGLAINAGGGSDTVNYGSTTLANITSMASFNFNGQAGFDTFNINNQTQNVGFTYTRNTGNVGASGTNGASYSLNESNNELVRFNGGPQTDSLYVYTVATGASVEFNGGAAIDGLVLGGGNNNVGGILGSIMYNGQADGGNMLLSDIADTTADIVHLTASSIGAYPGDTFFGPGGSLSFAGLVNFGVNPGITLNLGSGGDTIYAQPLATARVTINANNPTTLPGDSLNLALAAAQNPAITGTTAGNVTSSNLQTLNWTGIESSVGVDAVAPAVVVADINLNGIPIGESGSQQSVDVQFSEDVSALISAGWIELTNVTTAEVIPAGNIAVTYDAATNTAHFTFPGYANGILPDGNYAGKIYAGLPDFSGNAMPADAPFEFFFLRGDANHDRSVDITDLGTLATHWQGSGQFSDGDFNYDGTIDITDLGMLATNWQVNLPAPQARPTGNTRRNTPWLTALNSTGLRKQWDRAVQQIEPAPESEIA